MTEKMEYPKEMTGPLRDILGMPNFQCAPFAEVHRMAGKDIPRRSGDEQAFVLHWLVCMALEHGPAWREEADNELAGMVAKVRNP